MCNVYRLILWKYCCSLLVHSRIPGTKTDLILAARSRMRACLSECLNLYTESCRGLRSCFPKKRRAWHRALLSLTSRGAYFRLEWSYTRNGKKEKADRSMILQSRTCSPRSQPGFKLDVLGVAKGSWTWPPLLAPLMMGGMLIKLRMRLDGSNRLIHVSVKMFFESRPLDLCALSMDS